MQQRLLARTGLESSLVSAPVDDLDELVETTTLLWLDLEGFEAADIDGLCERFGFAHAAVEDILDLEQLPKFDDYGDHVFVVLHALTADGDRVDTIELDIFVRDGLLVTVHNEPIVGVDWLWNAVQSHPHLSTQGADEVLGHLAEVIGRRYFEIVHAIEGRIDELAEAALEADPDVIAAVQVLRREEATVRQMLRPQRLAIRELQSRNRSVIGDRAGRVFDDAFDVHNQVVESMALARGLLADMLDTYRGASAERQANATTVLAVYSAVLLPLTLVVGFYGMNVRGLPGSSGPSGWLAVLVAMTIIALLSTVLFVRSGMIRLPWTRPRNLVRGLAAAAVTPVHPFAMLRRPTVPDSGDGSAPIGRSGGQRGSDLP